MNLLKDIETKINGITKTNYKFNNILYLLDYIYKFSDINNYQFIYGDNNEMYYNFNISKENYVDIIYYIKIFRGSFNCEEYNGISILVDEVFLDVDDYPTEDIYLYRLDGVVEGYKFNYNDQKLVIPDSVKSLIKSINKKVTQ